MKGVWSDHMHLSCHLWCSCILLPLPRRCTTLSSWAYLLLTLSARTWVGVVVWRMCCPTHTGNEVSCDVQWPFKRVHRAALRVLCINCEDGLRDFDGQATPDWELVSLRVYMSAWFVPSLLVQLPARCFAIMKTSLGATGGQKWGSVS